MLFFIGIRELLGKGEVFFDALEKVSVAAFSEVKMEHTAIGSLHFKILFAKVGYICPRVSFFVGRIGRYYSIDAVIVIVAILNVVTVG